MAITQPGAYALTWEKMFIDTAAQTMEAETHKELLVLDTSTPDFDLDDFRDDVDFEVTGTNYTAGGVTVTGTEWTIATGLMTYDMTDTVYSNVTITDVMAGIFYFNVGSAATDQLLLLQDFVTAASATAADFTIQHAGTGVATLDHTV
jgi:phosphoserine aminotransferase